jgi:hypothetical protein
MFSLRATLQLRDCHKSLLECSTRWRILRLG